MPSIDPLPAVEPELSIAPALLGTLRAWAQTFGWSIDSEGALLITLDTGGTIRLIRLVDSAGNDAGAYVEIVGLPGTAGIEHGSIGQPSLIP